MDEIKHKQTKRKRIKIMTSICLDREVRDKARLYLHGVMGISISSICNKKLKELVEAYEASNRPIQIPTPALALYEEIKKEELNNSPT